MAKETLRVAELDFDQIKTNLKNFLKNQSEFSDYDFEGSGLNILIDLLAYNTHYNSYYLNMIANESFLDTALLRDSIVSHAKLLAYTPASKNAPIALVNISVETDNTNDQYLTLPRGTTFSSEIIGDYSYNFVTIQNHTVSKSNTKFLFENIELYEGKINTLLFTQTDTNPNQIYILPDENIDTRTIKVSVKEGPASSKSEDYFLSTDILELNSESNAFFLQEGKNTKYEIFFGDGFISKKLPDGAEITVSYLVTNGPEANKANSFINLENFTGTENQTYNDIIIQTVSPASGGSDRETVDSIKLTAPQRYATQNRLVTASDYAAYIKSNYPGIQSISVWGGEEQTPRVYNKTFISLKLKDGFFVSEFEKNRILNELVKPKAIVTTEAEIVEPDYLYLLITGSVKYEASKTNLTTNTLKNKIRDAIVLYNDNNLETFNSRYIQSRLQDDLDNSDSSFVGSIIQTRLQKRIPIFLNQFRKYTVDFGVELERGTLQNRLISKPFKILDFQGIERQVQVEEIPYSFNGIESIKIINPGFGYKTAPKITVLGDGSGATAIAKIKNGSLFTIEVTNPGTNYTTASIEIVGDGLSAAAIPVIEGKIGKLRIFYNDENSKTNVVVPDAGTIYYDIGLVELKDINIREITTNDERLHFTAYAKDTIIKSKRNLIILVDKESSESITVDLVPL